MNKIKLKVFTPLGVVYQNDVYTFETTTYKGRIGMCANQIPLIGLIKANLSTVKSEDGIEEFYICDGLIYQQAKKIKIFTSNFVNKNTLQNQTWLEQKQRIENKLKKAKDEILLYALNKQLNDINAKLTLIGLNQENQAK